MHLTFWTLCSETFCKFFDDLLVKASFRNKEPLNHAVDLKPDEARQFFKGNNISVAHNLTFQK
jgi:hypothetical protein